jgi:hypothetical protein
MWIFGHLGLGAQLASPFAKRLPFYWILLGTLVPDLIDKPLYYSLFLATGLSGDDLGWISCTRTVGHTGILLILVFALARIKKSKILIALGLGMITHLLLDGFQDLWNLSNGSPGPSSTLWAVSFPFFGRFASMPFDTASEHLKTVKQPLILAAECFGFLLLVWNYKKRR